MADITTGDGSRRLLALIVDDEPSLVDLVRLGLSYEGFQIVTAVDGEEAVRKVLELDPDLVILDVMLPRLDGFAVCERVRKHRDVPIIMLTARDDVTDRVHGLNLGADDYLPKPFRFEELLARIRAVLRRKHPAFGAVLQVGDVHMDVEAREVVRGDMPVTLTPREFDLLKLFLEHPRQIFSKETILNRVWGYDFVGGANVVEVYVSTLREKLRDQPPRLIQTLRGVGYRMASF